MRSYNLIRIDSPGRSLTRLAAREHPAHAWNCKN